MRSKEGILAERSFEGSGTEGEETPCEYCDSILKEIIIIFNKDGH